MPLIIADRCRLFHYHAAITSLLATAARRLYAAVLRRLPPPLRHANCPPLPMDAAPLLRYMPYDDERR
jgi:hypothetical protein